MNGMSDRERYPDPENLIGPGGHLTPAAFRRLAESGADGGERLRAAEHMAGCPACALAFSEYLGNRELAPVPPGFGEEVRGRIRAKKAGRVTFAFYSLRVALAACAALVFVFSGAFRYAADMPGRVGCVRAPDLRFVSAFDTQLRDFSQRVLDWEVFTYAKKEK